MYIGEVAEFLGYNIILCNLWLKTKKHDARMGDITDGKIWKEFMSSMSSGGRKPNNILGSLMNVD